MALQKCGDLGYGSGVLVRLPYLKYTQALSKWLATREKEYCTPQLLHLRVA